MLLVKKNGVAISYQHPYKLCNAKWYIDTCHFNIVEDIALITILYLFLLILLETHWMQK